MRTLEVMNGFRSADGEWSVHNLNRVIGRKLTRHSSSTTSFPVSARGHEQLARFHYSVPYRPAYPQR